MNRIRKYTLNETFFSSWNSKVAYVFGYWLADGYMRICRSYRVCFYSKDKEILEKIQSVLSTTTPIIKCNSGIAYELQLYSKQLYKDLERIGGFRNKSRNVIFPKIPKKLLRDFIRGYFDGDGSVHLITSRSSKNMKPYTLIRSNFTCGNLQFLEDLQQKLIDEILVHRKIIGKYGPYQYKLGYGQKDTLKLLHYMYYKGFEIGMERKRKYLDIKNNSGLF